MLDEVKSQNKIESSVKWKPVCSHDDLVPGSGICVLFEGQQVAIFEDSIDQSLFAVSNYDPIGKANVISRGIIGSLGDKRVVASPLYKQHFDLETGECIEESEVQLKTYQVKNEQGEISLLAS